MVLEFAPRLDLIAQIGNDLHRFLRGGRVVPKIRRFNFLFELSYLFLLAREVKDGPKAGLLIPVRESNDQASPA